MTTDAVVELRDGGRLAYDDVGDGPAVAFLHPGLWDRRVWEDQLRSLPAAGFRAIRYDARGYGASSFPDEAYDEVEDLRGLVDGIGVERAALVGCSMGGNVAIRFTLRYPERVWALVPVASALSGFDWDEEAWEPRWRAIEGAAAAGDLEAALELELRTWAPLGSDDPAGARIRSIAFDNLRSLTLDELDLASRDDPPPITRLDEIDVPTLVVLGEDDIPEITRIGETIEGRVPGARIAMIPGADHVVNLRQPERFDAAVIAFLREAAILD